MVLDRAELLQDRGRPLVLTLRGKLATSTRRYIYVDNIGVFGSDGRIVASRLEDVWAAFEARGLAVHEVSTSDSGVEALGVLLDGRRRRTGLTSKRFWRVRGALLALAARRRVAGRQVEAVIGHATFCGLVRRETLTVFSTVYPFIRRHYDEPVMLWASVEDELRVFAAHDYAGLQLGVRLETARDGHGRLGCSRWFDPVDVAAVGRCRERDRYFSEDHVAARAAALDGEVVSPSPESLGVEGCLGRDDLLPDPGFSEVPTFMTEQAAWTTFGGWKFNQAGRATRKRHVSSSAASSASRPRTSRTPTSTYRRGLEALKGRASLADLSGSEVVALLEELRSVLDSDPRFANVSSSESEAGAPVKPPARRRRTAPRTQRSAMAKLLESPAIHELSRLPIGEHAAVRPRTESQCAQEIHQFSRFAGVARVIDVPLDDLDDLLVKFMGRQIRRG
ncbi:unnamed protein product, partial [Prorocentrum cordatum]